MQSRTFPHTKSERHFDISLRLLMVAVGATLAGCIVWLGLRWAQPPTVPADLVPLTELAPRSGSLTAIEAGSSEARQLLLAPGQVFRCVSGNRVTFTDRPCPTTVR